MLPALGVSVVVNGSLVPSSTPARIAAGRVVAPLAPIVTALATRITLAPDGASVIIDRADRRITVPVALTADAMPFVELAHVVRALGGYVQFDPVSKTIAIVLFNSGVVTTPVPFDPRTPQVTPTMVFTPEPPKPTPRAIETGVPVPRRTAIPVVPSQPVIRR